MRISYIVSAYNNPNYLPCLLHSLKVQTDQSFEVIVTDNSDDPLQQQLIEHEVNNFRFLFGRPWYVRTIGPTCFHSAEEGARFTLGEFLCFPSDDSYYVPTFGETMYKAAIETPADLVLCDMLYDPRSGQGRYAAVEQHPRRNWFDKTGFILRRSLFEGFPNKVDGYDANRTGAVVDCADGMLAESLVARGVSYKELRDVLVVHN